MHGVYGPSLTLRETLNLTFDANLPFLMPSHPDSPDREITSDDIVESMKRGRRSRWNPLRAFSGERLAVMLDSFDAGDLREFAMLAKAIADRDDTIKGVKAKREKAVAHRKFAVVTLEDGPEAERQKEVLERFWRRVRWVDAWDRSRKGKRKRLIQAMQEAVSYGYSVHHIVWNPTPDGELRATFEHVPLWFFENRETEMRVIPNGIGYTGIEMAEQDWLISTGDALMVACSIGYSAKRNGLMDWIRFSEKFSIPGVVGKTSAAKGSPQGNAMREAVARYNNDWATVLYGADGTETIELVEANGNPTAMPMPALIEMVNRKFAALYRGADLSTMSGSTSTAAGASLQGEEADILERDDAADRSEDMQRVEATVLRWYFGEDVDALAEGRIIVPDRAEQAAKLNATKVFVDMGARIGREEVLSDFGMSEAEPGEAVFTRAGADTGQGSRVTGEELRVTGQEEETDPAMNARITEGGDEMLAAASELLALARRDDMAALRGRLRDILVEQNPVMMRVALDDLNRDLPKFLESTPATDAAWERIMLTAIAEGWAAEPSGE